MPHAIYLHSSLTQNRIVGVNESEKKQIFKLEFIDIIIAMIIAGAVNMAMVIVSAALFFKNGLVVEDLDVAFQQFGHLATSNGDLVWAGTTHCGTVEFLRRDYGWRCGYARLHQQKN